MTYQEAVKVLTENNQLQVLRFWDTLSVSEQTALLAQIASLDFASIRRMQQML
jgi:hypothetical protein